MTMTSRQESHGPLLQVRDLRSYFFAQRGVVRAVDGVDFDVQPGEAVALVGESGSGKSVTAHAILRLLPHSTARIVGGEILYEGRDLVSLSDREMRRIRGKEIAIVFQDPLTSLNPLFTVGEQVGNSFRFHGQRNGRVEEKVLDVLRRVGISSPQIRARQFPHQLSGGMRQRVTIAMAVGAGPKLLIADEPTTALDVTIQRQIVDLLRELRQELGMALLFITHDLNLAAEISDRVLVMYAGRIVEAGATAEVLVQPKHPYTRSLLAAVPRISEPRSRLVSIPGAPPSPLGRPSGCPFHPRCPNAMPICTEQYPPKVTSDSGQEVACWLHKS